MLTYLRDVNSPFLDSQLSVCSLSFLVQGCDHKIFPSVLAYLLILLLFICCLWSLFPERLLNSRPLGILALTIFLSLLWWCKLCHMCRSSDVDVSTVGGLTMILWSLHGIQPNFLGRSSFILKTVFFDDGW